MDSTILRKLQAFAARRRRLIIIRGICTALAMLLATMMVVALVDRLFILPDTVRWTLSGAAYLAVLVAEWRACWRLLLHLPDPRRLARLVEHMAPHLREDLLSAVELSQGDGALDSPEFRELVQSDVARRMAGLDAEDLLPVNLLRRSFAWLGIVLVVLAAAFFISGGTVGFMLLRAMLPMANLARISTVKVRVVEPDPASRIVPQGDAVPLRIETSGGEVEKAWLETFSASGKREVQGMTPAGNGRFAAAVQIGREDVEYRVRAGDAITQKFRLHAAARPHVVTFHKTYHYPGYTQLPPKEVTEPSGDITALEGTQVEVRLETDQPVAKAELRVETGQSSAALPLERGKDGTLSATMTLSASGVYRVHLVAAQSGFENKFSPDYELRANPDLIPKMTLEEPPSDTVASTSETIELAGTATDDLSVSAVEQMYRVNEGAWKSLPLAITPGPTAAARNLWDLSQEKLRPGDQITAKLVAIDQRGGRGESRPVQITLAESGFDQTRAALLAEQVRLLKGFSALRAAAENMERTAQEARNQTDRGNTASNEPKAWEDFGQALDNFELRSREVTAEFQKVLPQAGAGRGAGDLVMLSRAFSRLNGLALWMRGLQRAMQDPDVGQMRRDVARELSDAGHWVVPKCRQAEEACRSFVGNEEIEVATENMQVVWRDQAGLAEIAKRVGGDAAGWARVSARLKVISAEAVQVEETMKAAAPHAMGGMADGLRRYARRLEDARNDAAKANQAPVHGNELLTPTLNYSNVLADAANGLLQLSRESANWVIRSDQATRNDVQPDWIMFERMHGEVSNYLRQERYAPTVRMILAGARWDERVLTWKEHGDFEEIRPDADNYFVQDLRNLVLALPALREQLLVVSKNARGDEGWKDVQKLDFAFRTTEAVHDLVELAGGLDALAAEERWEGRALRARTAAPGEWVWLEDRLRHTPESVNRIVQTTPEMRKSVQEAQEALRKAIQEQPARTASEAMQRRWQREHVPVTQETSIRAVAARVREAIAALRPLNEEAKTAVAQMTPKLAERLAQLAKDATDLKQRSDEQAKQEAKSPEAAQSEARQTLAAQQKLDEQLEAVKDAIRNDAQRQDVMKQEGRERARDADDALGMLREPPPRAEQALADAAASEKPDERQEAMHTAAQEQQKLASALEQLAKHYDALEQGKAEETRTALRQAEKALGLQPELDRQFAQTDQLAKAAQASPQEMLKALERALPQNPLMRQELSGVAKETLHGAAEKLAEASAQEEKVAQNVNQMAAEQAKQAAEQARQAAEQARQQAAANAQQAGQPNAPQPNPGAQPNPADAAKNAQAQASAENQGTMPKPAGAESPQGPLNPKLAQAASQQPAIGQTAARAGEEVERAGRHEERLRHMENGEQLQRLGRQVQATGREDVPRAKAALEQAEAAAQAQTPVAQASERLQHQLGRLTEAADGKPEMNAPMPQANATTPASPGQNAQATAQPGDLGVPKAGMPEQAAAQTADANGQRAGTPGAPAQPGDANGEKPGTPAATGAPMVASTPPVPGQQPDAGAAAHPGDTGTPPNAGLPIPPEGGTAAPQQQVWMARALDALDAAMHSDPNQGGDAAQNGQAAAGQQPQQGQQQAQQGQQAAQAMNDAQQAMNAAAQAAAAAMRANRSQPPTPAGKTAVAKGGEEAVSRQGAEANLEGNPYGALPKGVPGNPREGGWGRLPKQMAEQLTQGQREGVSAEYRNQVETYYRVIAERAKKR